MTIIPQIFLETKSVGASGGTAGHLYLVLRHVDRPTRSLAMLGYARNAVSEAHAPTSAALTQPTAFNGRR